MKLIVMRHSECIGLDKNIINGWMDFGLTEQGKKEAFDTADKLMKQAQINNIDKVYTSHLSRTIDTAKFLLQGLNQNIDVISDIRLNERHYGAFQGMNKELARKYKEYNTLSISAERLDNRLIPMSDEEYEKQIQEYSKKLSVEKEKLYGKLPRCESILDVEKRVIDFLQEKILIPENRDEIILIVGHANTVKLIVKYIEKLNYNETTKLRFAACGMKIYDLTLKDKGYIIDNIQNINKEWI